MSSSFGTKHIVARKAHVCMLCGEAIPAGMTHTTWTYVDGGQIGRCRAHFRCDDRAIEFDWYRYDDWGIEDFPLRLSLEQTGEWEAFKAGGAS